MNVENLAYISETARQLVCPFHPLHLEWVSLKLAISVHLCHRAGVLWTWQDAFRLDWPQLHGFIINKAAMFLIRKILHLLVMFGLNCIPLWKIHKDLKIFIIGRHLNRQSIVKQFSRYDFLCQVKAFDLATFYEC